MVQNLYYMNNHAQLVCHQYIYQQLGDELHTLTKYAERKIDGKKKKKSELKDTTHCIELWINLICI